MSVNEQLRSQLDKFENVLTGSEKAELDGVVVTLFVAGVDALLISNALEAFAKGRSFVSHSNGYFFQDITNDSSEDALIADAKSFLREVKVDQERISSLSSRVFVEFLATLFWQNQELTSSISFLDLIAHLTEQSMDASLERINNPVSLLSTILP